MTPMTVEQARHIYDPLGSSVLQYQVVHGYHKCEIIPFVDMADLKPGESVLDLGTGIGWVALEAKMRVQHGRVVGVDASPRSLETARGYCAAALGSNTGNATGSITFLESDMSKIATLRASLGTPTPTFNAIFCCAALQHVPGGLIAQSLVLKDWATLLTPGGRIVVDWIENPDYAKVGYLQCWPIGRPIVGEPNPSAFSALLTSFDQWDTCERLFRDAVSLVGLSIKRLDRVHYHTEKDWSEEVMQEVRRQWADGIRYNTLKPTDKAEFRRLHGSKMPELFAERVRQDMTKAYILQYQRRGWMACHSNVAVRAVLKRE